jgi:parvulin-like peptidyl-prolyl isomerase
VKRQLATVGLLLLAAAGDPPASPPPVSPPAPVVAERGDLKLTSADVKSMLARLDPAARAKVEASSGALANFVRDKMVDELLLAQAKDKGWDQNPDVVQRINDARDSVILQTYAASLVPPDPNFPPDQAIAATYEANKAKFMIPKQFHIAQIAILVPANAKPAADEAALRKANELRAQAVKPKADFAQLARKNSQDTTTADKGGDAGWVRDDAIVPAIRGVVENLSDNAVSDVIRLPDGYHIIRLLGTRPPAPAPLDDVRPQLVQLLRQARTQQGIRAYVDAMLKAQPIQLNEIDLAKQVGGNP